MSDMISFNCKRNACFFVFPVGFSNHIPIHSQVMDNHKIVDTGTHDGLVANCDKYRELIKRQSVMASPNNDAFSSIV